MKINNKSIRGIFIYSDDAVFEKGDFVLDDEYLYICQADTSVGERPSEASNKFSLYVGGEFATEEDFKAYASGTSTDNSGKFVSAYLLGRILNSYMAGYDEYGVITNQVGADGEIFVTDFFGSEYGSTLSGTKYLDPLKEIMIQPALNNAIFTVHRDVVKKVLGTSQEGSTDRVLLKQYTYKESAPNSYVRIQELIDQKSGSVHYRYLKFSGEDFSGEISSWASMCTSVRDKEIVDEIKAYYESLIDAHLSHTALQDSFRFVEAPILGNGSVNISNLPGNTITLCLGKEGTIYKTANITIPLADIGSISGGIWARTYRTFDNEEVTVLVTTSSSFVQEKFLSVQGSNVKILSAYYKLGQL